jgi:hypothetical protein
MRRAAEQLTWLLPLASMPPETCQLQHGVSGGMRMESEGCCALTRLSFDFIAALNAPYKRAWKQ